MLEWASHGDCVLDEELPLHASWVELRELDVTMSRAYALGNREQCAQNAAWACAIRQAHGPTALPTLGEVETDVVAAACAAEAFDTPGEAEVLGALQVGQ